MKDVKIQVNDGEIKVTMEKPVGGRFNLKELGLSPSVYEAEGGNLRLVFELGYLEDFHFYRMPIIDFKYTDNIHESGWVVEFNGENMLEKTDHSGKATVLLLKRDQLADKVHRHSNRLIVHGDFSDTVAIDFEKSHFHLLEEPGS